MKKNKTSRLAGLISGEAGRLLVSLFVSWKSAFDETKMLCVAVHPGKEDICRR